MADIQVGGVDINFTNSRRATSDMGGNGSNLGTVANYGSIAAMRTALAAANAGYYTAAKLNEMSANDMVFALRNIQDATSIASYMTNSTA